jgi:hypothetical protein
VAHPITDFITGKQFTVKGDGYTSPRLGDLYDNRDKLVALKKAYGDNMPANLQADYEAMNKAYYTVNNEIAKSIHEITNNKHLSPKEKQAQINALDKQRNEIARKLFDSGMYDRVKKYWK